MDYTWYDIAGLLGVALVIGSYLGLQLGYIKAEGLGYSVANAVGAALIIVSLWYDFNLSALVVEGFWVLISLIGIGRYVYRKQRAVHESEP